MPSQTSRACRLRAETQCAGVDDNHRCTVLRVSPFYVITWASPDAGGYTGMDAIIIGLIVCVVAVFVVWRYSRTASAKHSTLLPRPTDGAHLLCISGPNKGQEYSLHKSQVVLGRSSKCDVMVSADLVSRTHALITSDGNQYVLFDHGSMNGTWVNGQRILQHVLRVDDQIQIGPAVFAFRTRDGTAAAAEPIRIHSPTPSPSPAVYTISDYELLDTFPGGAATVYKARARQDGRIVALKVLHSPDPYIRDKFVKEIEIGKILRHPHIVPVMGGDHQDGVWYMVMEYMEGGTLRNRLSPGQPKSVDFTVRVIGQICEALAYAHERGVFHRDIKPENILFDANQTAALGDFGIARVAQSVTRTEFGVVLGTPLYMSYEQAKGNPIDHRTDIYSLGVVLYEMATGWPPFMGSDALSIVGKHVHESPPKPRQLNPAIPWELEQVILAALKKDRGHRIQTAWAMAGALGYESTGVSISQSAPQTTYGSRSPAAQKPAGPLNRLRLIRFDNVPISVDQPMTELGRETVNAGDFEISRKHARVAYQAGYWWIHDLSSANGTYVNQLRVFEPVMLQAGDVIRLGQTILHVAD